MSAGKSQSKCRVAILGAGPAGLAAAFALTRTEELRDRYDVTVYQAGWRAGGKCSTGRAMNKGWRIEQNGSHYLFGCYGNTFAMIREAYEVLEEKGETSFGDYRSQFVPRTVVVGQKADGSDGSGFQGSDPDGPWFLYLPETLEWPDHGGKYPPPSHFVFMLGQYALLWALWLLLLIPYRAKAAPHAMALLWMLLPLSPFHTGLWPRVVRSFALPLAWLIDAVAWLLRPLVALSRVLVRAVARRWIVRAIEMSCRVARRAVDSWPLRRLHRFRIMVSLLTAGLLGLFEDRLWEAGSLEAIDGRDFRDWLKSHGASDDAIDCSLVKSWYDAVVAYEHGDTAKPRISAGVSIHALFRAMATYKGAFAYQMSNEVGDSVIAPVVKALEHRNVRFEFFRRVRDIVCERDMVTRVVLEKQVADESRDRHEVLVDMPTEPPRQVWPNQPVLKDVDGNYVTLGMGDGDLLPNHPNLVGPNLEECHDPPATQLDSSCAPYGPDVYALELGTDFDHVVFALPLAMVDRFDGLRDRPGWDDAHRHVMSVPTQSTRLWFRKSLAELGWTAPPPILSGFAPPFSTWEDNSQTSGHECFDKANPPLDEPKTIATLFGPRQEEGDPPADLPLQPAPDVERAYKDSVATRALTFYEERAEELWPALDSDERFRALVAPDELHGAARFHWQFTSANIGRVARYVIALPGTLGHRMRSDETGIRNMVAAGDWTRNGFEVGCVEGAVMAGLEAAKALCGLPFAILGEDDLTFGPFRSGPAVERGSMA